MLSNVRLPIDERESVVNVDGYRVHATSETEIPANGIACSNEGVLPASNEILADLTASISNLTYTFEDEQQRQIKALNTLCRGFAIVHVMSFAPSITIYVRILREAVAAYVPVTR